MDNDKGKVKEIEQLLRKAGLDEDEVSVFLATLQLGSKPASVISKKAHVGRSLTYQILRNLSARGLIIEVTKNGISQFSTCTPEDFTSKLATQIEEMKSVVTQLSVMLPTLMGTAPSSATKVEFWRGDHALMGMWDKYLHHPNTAISGFFDYSLRWPANRGAEAQAWDNKFSAKRAELGIAMRVICNRSPGSDEAWKTRKKFLREMKVIENFNIPIAVLIHSSAVMITCNADQVFGVVIRDLDVSRGFQQVFDSAWERLPDYAIAG
jgi:hypothetical protein